MILSCYISINIVITQKDWTFLNHGAFGAVIKQVLQASQVGICRLGSGGSRIWWKGGRELSQIRAKPLFEARSGERGVGQGGGCPPSLCGRKWKSGNA